MTAPDWPRSMRRKLAAAYVDLPAAKFDKEVAAGVLPCPFILGGEEHWSRHALDEALERLTGDSTPDWRRTSKLYGDAA